MTELGPTCGVCLQPMDEWEECAECEGTGEDDAYWFHGSVEPCRECDGNGGWAACCDCHEMLIVARAAVHEMGAR